MSLSAVRATGLEGTGSYGAGLCRFLRERGREVLEVNRPNASCGTRRARATPSTLRARPVRC